MFGSLGGAEIILILVLALLLFGPRKLPQIGRTIGGALAEFRKATNEFKSNLEREVDLSELRAARRDAGETLRELGDLGNDQRETDTAAPSAPATDEPDRRES